MSALNPTVRASDVARLSHKQGAILDMLIARPRTAIELCACALSYRQRVSELRQAGHVIECEHKLGGATVYTYRGYTPSTQLKLV
jgi:hypothetical protein